MTLVISCPPAPWVRIQHLVVNDLTYIHTGPHTHTIPHTHKPTHTHRPTYTHTHHPTYTQAHTHTHRPTYTQKPTHTHTIPHTHTGPHTQSIDIKEMTCKQITEHREAVKSQSILVANTMWLLTIVFLQ